MKFAVTVLFSAALFAQDKYPPNSSSIDSDGTTHITRTVPMPATLSPEAQKWTQQEAERDAKQTGEQPSIALQRAGTDAWRAYDVPQALKHYPAKVESATVAGVKCDIITSSRTDAHDPRVLLNFHGGGFIVDSGSLIEGIPIANLTGMKVVSVYYRLAPENPYPAAVDDGVAVYRELLKTHNPSNIGIFGTSAGAILTAEVAARLKQLKLPQPGALGIFSGLGDFSHASDSMQLFTLNGFGGHSAPKDPNEKQGKEYVGKTDPRDPVLSPLFSDLHGLPPTLLVTSTRDILLSDTTTLHRALRRAGVQADLVVYDALPHAFWYHFDLPETKDALQTMADFFSKNVGAKR